MSSPDLGALLDLQDLDTALDRCTYRLAHLDERRALDEHLATRAGLADRRAVAVVARDEVAGRQAASEAELASTEARMAAVSKRLYGGDVTASRDLQAMSGEIATLKERGSALEDEVLAELDEREPLDAVLDALDTEDRSLAERQVQLEADLASTEADVANERDGLAARRPELAGRIPEALLATYQRLRDRLGGVGAARLVSGRCDGCHLVLPATELDRLRHLPDDEVVTCEQCGRILVRPS